MNTIDKYGDPAVIKAFLTRNFSEIGYEFSDDVITTLKNYAFAGITDLKTLSIPNVTYISNACFLDTQVEETSEISWDKVTHIGVAAFYGSTVIKDSTLNLPLATEIGTSAFHGVNGITGFQADKWETVVTASGPYLSTDGIFEESTIQTFSAPLLNDANFSNKAFKGCTSLISVDLPLQEDGGLSMFQGCTALTEISLPSLKRIAKDCNYMFEGCTALTKVSLPELTEITGRYTFDGCSVLTEISLPNVEGIVEDHLCADCLNLESASLPKATELRASCFYQCEKLTDEGLNIPNLTKTSVSVFSGCSSLENVKFDKLSDVGSSTFYRCTSLVTADLPAATTLASYIFSYDSALEKVRLGGDISTLPSYLFQRCTKLDTLLLPGLTAVPTLATNTFSVATKINNKTGIIYVPDSLVDEFTANSSWSKYNIQGISSYTGTF